MKKIKKSIILSLLASACFFITFIIAKETLNLILSIIWLIITFGYLTQYKKLKK